MAQLVANQNQAASGPHGMDHGVMAGVRDGLAHLRRRRARLFLAALVMLAAGALLAGWLPRLYTATAQILVGLPAPGADMALVESQALFLKSNSILLPVVQQNHIEDDPEFDGDPAKGLSAAFWRLRTELFGTPSADKAAVALAKLAEAVTVRRLPGSSVIELGVRSTEAAKAARLAGAITQTFIAARAPPQQTAPATGDAIDEVKADMQRAEAAVEAFKRDNKIVETNEWLVSEQQLGDLTNQLAAARLRVDDLEARSQQIQAILGSAPAPAAGSAAAVHPSAMAQLKSRYGKLKRNLDSLFTAFGARNRSLNAARAQLEAIRQLIVDEIGRIAAAARDDVERAKAGEAELSRQVETKTREAGAVATAAIHLRELEHDAAARRADYMSLLARTPEKAQPAGPPAPQFSVISAPVAPLRPGGIPAFLVVAGAVLVGSGVAAAGLVGLDHLAGRLMTPRQVNRASALPLLALVRRRSPSLLEFLRLRPRSGRPRTSAKVLAQLRDRIGDAAPDQPPRIILFLSGSAAAAESSLPLDLARNAGERGDRVLLIDADDDRLTRSLQTTEQERRGWSPVRRTHILNLSVLSRHGAFTAQRSGEGSTPVMRLAAEHDFIFVHASVGGTALRLRQVAEAATNIVLILDADDTTIGAIDALRQEIGLFAAKIDGFVWVTGDV
jgi:uncharacterized protein involved in exopolysaccharide biosynthesis